MSPELPEENKVIFGAFILLFAAATLSSFLAKIAGESVKSNNYAEAVSLSVFAICVAVVLSVMAIIAVIT